MNIGQLLVGLSILGIEAGVDGTVASGAAYPTPSTGGTVNIQNEDLYTVLCPASSLANLTVVLPGAPVDRQIQFISTIENISTLSVNGAGRNVIAVPTTLNAGQRFGVIWRQATVSWYPI